MARPHRSSERPERAQDAAHDATSGAAHGAAHGTAGDTADNAWEERPRAPRIVAPTTAATPFPAEFLDTVFVVPDPPVRWPSPFAVVTACNPGARVASDADNLAATARLDAHLAEAGVESFVVVGTSRDFSHREPGRGFATRDLDGVAALARRFGQVGFFWVERGLVLVCTDASGRGWPVGRWRDLLRAAPSR